MHTALQAPELNHISWIIVTYAWASLSSQGKVARDVCRDCTWLSVHSRKVRLTCYTARMYGTWVQACWQWDGQAGDPYLNRGNHAHQPCICHCDGALTEPTPTQHVVNLR